MLRATLLALSLTLSAPQVSADTFDDADNALERGDFDTAAKIFKELAEQGDPDAQTNLGFMYENGQGVLQDNIKAHMWYNLATANGYKNAGEWRDKRAALMTATDIATARAMARECMNSGYKNCGD